jgi:hypothetical protein
MLKSATNWLLPSSDIPLRSFYLRVLWVVMQLIAAYSLSNQVSPFFYQRF